MLVMNSDENDVILIIIKSKVTITCKCIKTWGNSPRESRGTIF